MRFNPEIEKETLALNDIVERQESGLPQAIPEDEETDWISRQEAQLPVGQGQTSDTQQIVADAKENLQTVLETLIEVGKLMA